MSLNPIVDIFGVDSIAFYNRTDYTFYGRLRCLQSSTLAITGKIIENTGGSSPFPWDAQPGKQDGKLDIKATEYPDFVFQLFGGAAPTENTPDALGFCSVPVNRKGTSIIGAAGLASVQVLAGSEANLKFGRYVLKAITASSLQIYAAYDTDFNRGTVVTYLDDTLAVLAAATTIATTVVNPQTALGISLTGGGSVTAFVVGDTATFEIRPKNSQNMNMVLGGVGLTFPEFGAIVMAKRKSTGEMFEAEVFRAVATGLPVHFDEDKFANWDVKCTLLQDPNQPGVARLRRIMPLTPS